jgi:hypothetical protein
VQFGVFKGALRPELFEHVIIGELVGWSVQNILKE